MDIIRAIADPLNRQRIADLELFARHLNIQLGQAYDQILALRQAKAAVYVVKKHERFEHGYYKQFVLHGTYSDDRTAFYEAARLNDSKHFHYTVERLEAK